MVICFTKFIFVKIKFKIWGENISRGAIFDFLKISKKF
jgi:hypothetical protein